MNRTNPKDAPSPPRLSVMVASVLGWSLMAGLSWSLFDAGPLADEIGVGYVEAWLAAAVAASKVALGVLPLGAAAGWIWHRTRWGGRARRLMSSKPAACGAAAVAASIAWLVLSFTTFGALTLFRQVFASELVHQLATSISTPIFAGVAAGLGWAVFGVLRPTLGRLGSATKIAWVTAFATLLLAAGWVGGLILLGIEVWRNLVPHIYLPFAVIAVASLMGALLADYARVRKAVVLVGAITLMVAAAGATTEASKPLRLALEFRDTGTSFITRLTSPDEQDGFAAAEMNRGKSAVCAPGTSSPKLSDVGTAAPTAPDIIWVTVDALRWDHTSMAGYERDVTPNLARFASRAAVFEQAYTPASSTRQTFRSLFTGVHPSMIDPPRAPIYALSIAQEQHTLPEYLAQAGYHTLALVTDAYIFSADHGGMQGFAAIDESFYEMKDEQGYCAPQVIDRLIDELDDAERPTFAWTHLIEPHAPFLTGPDPIDYGPHEIDRYDAAIHFVDDELERLLEFVAQRQSERPTYLVISADHGEAFHEHGQKRHGSTTFREQVHVPLMVWGPDVTPARHREPVGVLDLFATTFEMAGLEPPPGSCTRSLAESIRTGRPPEPRPVFIEQVPDDSRTFFSASFIRGSDKLVLQPKVDAVSLFDLEEDPGEQHDLAPKNPERLDDHLDVLRTYFEQRGMDPADYALPR